MVFVNQKITKYYSFNAHTETILILQKSVKRQLRFLSLSLAFTAQLCAIATEGTARKPSRKIAPVGISVAITAAITNLIKLDVLQYCAAGTSASVTGIMSPAAITSRASRLAGLDGRPPRYPGPRTRRRNADGSPTRARVAIIRVR
ncbi:MAG TPA: hypothetical protein VJJ81_04510 [Candidatus Babeliales bacterium]|nr:hypothetical protein [Candidatus Babeliales bacterium]